MGAVVAGLVALSLGRELLNSVTVTVVSFRAGNILPLVTVAILTAILLRVAARFEKDTPQQVLLNVLAWASVVYLSVTVLVATLPYGILTVLSTTGVTIFVCGVISDPSDAEQKLRSFLPSSNGLMPLPLGDTGGAVFSVSLMRQGFRVLIPPKASREKIVQLLKDRPALPVSIVNLEDNDFILVKTKDDKTLLTKTMEVVEQAGVHGVKVARPLLADAVVNLPLIEDDRGMVKMNEYRVAVEEKTIEKVLDLWPKRMTLVPGKEGLRAIVRPDSVMGLELEEIPRGQEAQVVLGRDLSMFDKGDVVNGSST
jgi:hypothetical protein